MFSNDHLPSLLYRRDMHSKTEPKKLFLPPRGCALTPRYCNKPVCCNDELVARLRPRGLPLGSLAWWGCAARFSKSRPYFRPKMSFFTPVFRPGPKEIMSSLHRLEQQQKRFLIIHFQFAHFSFLLTYLKLKRVIRLYAPVVPSKTIPYSKPKRRKNHTRWGGTHLYGIYMGYRPGLRPSYGDERPSCKL